MKYKILLVSLLSTLAIPYGTATAMDWKLRIPFANPHQIKVANEAQDQAAITLSRLDHQIGGNGAIDATQRLQTLTGLIDEKALSLEAAVNTLTEFLSEIPGDDLNAQINYVLQEMNKYKITNQALRQEIDAREHEQAEVNMLLNDVLQQPLEVDEREHEQAEMNILLDDVLQQPLLPVQQPMPPEMQPLPYPMLSPYQQELLPRRHQIGDEAWKLLGGENPSLAAALAKRINENSEKTLEVSYVGKKNFKLCINGKHQSQPYTF